MYGLKNYLDILQMKAFLIFDCDTKRQFHVELQEKVNCDEIMNELKEH